MQIQMALGSVTPGMIQQFMEQLAGYFAPSFDWALNGDAQAGQGSFSDMLAAVAPIWMGITNPKCNNVSIDQIGEDAMQVVQCYSSHIASTATNQAIRGTQRELEVTHNLQYDTASGKVIRWSQQYPAEQLTAMRAAAKFDHYDKDNDQKIDFEETKEMMLDLSYRVTDDYVDNVMDIFGTFDDPKHPHG